MSNTIASALEVLNKKKDVKVIGNDIYVLNGYAKYKANDLGNGSWGKIDFLRKKGYRMHLVRRFPHFKY